MSSDHNIIKNACDAIMDESITRVKEIIHKQYPFIPLTPAGRNYSEYEKTKVFIRDGFIDRYSGRKMVFPPVLRLLSNLMPTEFPYHKNWKMSECHIAYWQLLPTIDHIIPVTRGGEDKESNWVCTSQLRNSVKSNWLLEELDWKLHESGNLDEWDGLLEWFKIYVKKHPNVLDDNYINSWYKAAKRAEGLE
jgi:5-methylcytosine-specific restriction endonuclease McrA